MSELKNLSEGPEAAERRASWRRLRMHRIGDLPFDSYELAEKLKADADHREAVRRIAICELMDLNDIPNSADAHAAAIQSLWTPCVFDALGNPPTPLMLVRWRDSLDAASPKTGSARHLRRGSN